MTISKQQMEQLLVILGILIIIVLLVPPIWVRLALFMGFIYIVSHTQPRALTSCLVSQ